MKTHDTPSPELLLEGGVPIHRQIHDRIRECIARGLLRPGDELPSVRMAAVELAVNPNAVLRAYTELEGEGLLTSQDGSGILVAAAPPPAAGAPSRSLTDLCSMFLAWAQGLGFSLKEVQRTFDTLIRRSASS
jgi:GntR family transcriptional regulator